MMKQVDMYKRAALIAVMGLSLAGCSTVKGWFAGKDAAAKKAQEPAELVKFEPSVKVDKIWSTGVGKGEGHIGVRQRPAVADGKVYAAAITGGVQALDLQTGKHVWEYKPKKEERNDRKFKQRLSGGPGVGEGLVVIGSLSGDVIALNQADGTEKWRAKVPNEVIAAPAIAQNLVLVRSNDGRVTAFDAATGERRWFHAEEGPTLSVRGNAPIVTGPGVVFVGNDSGTLSALALQDGRPLWEQAIGVPEGRTELERMSDVDGAPVLDGTTLYATSFKNETLALEGPSGRPLWTRDHGGAGGVGVSSAVVVVSDNAGSVWGLDKSSGAAMWSQAALARRSLTGVAIQGDYAVVGDYKGYLHWLKLSDGALAARARAGRDTLLAQPQVVDGILLVQNTDGDLTAFRLAQ
ncbi:outer membrane protein assembly factor BamB [Xanthomonas oryzae pv. oryzae]|uniref:Outer membrane protein assembly factor BamB n=3 Tax=Xanthomonas oryzae TaxID=347 RepID=A0AAJ5MCG8_XANOO|nr:outer membrane protein assembly factor BamB [Xanthomonas oryzae pv. oryzae]QIE19873.1 outer membrane protein assembly factor BamB [Xanthomonas oryzae pv. oryzae]RBL08376.1 outer membrane protein assembly factor BamB [Xanthomonas oryzae pv. oryzae]UWU53196.1 outer membrane protein assembly factor BamB [Xanthomonas oryzae pv. oryzae]UXV78973.1 outer membrane protein assembly factor BamB [Xanthomonas oryzae pv. oryzae]